MHKNYYFLALIYFLSACSNGSEKQVNKEAINFDTAFDKRKWMESNEYGRGRMVNDLIKTDRLTALTKDSIVQLLGSPSQKGNWFWVYLVNSKDTSIANNYMLLHIEFDSSNKRVVEYWLSD